MRKRLANLRQKLIDFERLEQHGLQAFLTGANDAVIGIIAKARHEDHRHLRASTAGGGKHIIAGLIRHLDVAENQFVFAVFGLGFDMRNRLGPVGGDGDIGVELAENFADRRAKIRLIIGDQDTGAAQDRVFTAFHITGTQHGFVRAVGSLP